MIPPAFPLVSGLLVLSLQTLPPIGIGTISGVVRDQQGGAIGQATVDIACGDLRRRGVTSATGEFTESGLPAGRCSVTAASEFFEPETIVFDTRSASPATLVLQVRRFAAETVVTPRGVEENAFSAPEPMSVTTRRDVEARPFTLLAQVLREEPGILLQQTSSAQTSPVIRGFTGQSNVYLVDGVRLNNSAWRSGPSQYLAWVPPTAIDSIEVVRGVGSVQYGSDALGGTVQFLTPAVVLAPARAPVQGAVEAVAGSADRSAGAQGEVALDLRRGSVRVSGLQRRVGDLRAGGGVDSHSAVTRFLGLSSRAVGSRLKATSFDHTGATALATFTTSADAVLRLLYMHGSIGGSSRYDRVLGGEGLFESGFDPQTLDFALVRYSKVQVAGFDGISATASLNRQADGRYEQARPGARLDRQDATTRALGYQAQAHRSFAARHELTVGAELYDESIGASRQLLEPTGVVTAARPDIPGGTSYTHVGVFGQQTFDVVPNRLTVRGGLRYGRYVFDTARDLVLGVPDEHVAMDSVTFQTAAVLALSDAINVTANASRGFRAPNAADLGSIGLTGGGGFEIAPSRAIAMGALVGTTAGADARSSGARVGGLRPEVVYQYEAGVKARAGRASGAVSAFDMELFDFIQRRALIVDADVVGTTISGFQVARRDAGGLVYIAQDIRPMSTRVNIDRARVLGVDAEGELRFTPSWTAGAHFSMANGRLLPAGEFVRRMNPPMGGARLRWMGDRSWVEGLVSFAGAQTRLSSADLSDARIGALRTRASIATFFNGTATDIALVRNGVLVQTGESLAEVQNRVLGGAASAPLFSRQSGFAVVGLRGGVRLTPQLDLTLIGENLGDANYRLYGSGLDAPGFNVQVRTRYRF